MENARVTHCGKEIKLDGRRIADAVDEATAHIIVILLEYAGTKIPPEYQPKIEEFFA